MNMFKRVDSDKVIGNSFHSGYVSVLNIKIMNAEFNKLRNIIGDKDTVDELVKLLTDEQINAFIEHVKAHYDLEWHK